MVVENYASNGTTSESLALSLERDTTLREAVAAADIIVLGIGGADLNAGDDALAAGSCEGTDCYDPPIAEYRDNVDAIAAEIERLRGEEPTVIRAITQPNVLTGAEDVIPPFLSDISTEVGVYVARGFNDATCAAMVEHGGQCVDVLTAINGPDGTEDGYEAGLLNHDACCYPNEQGHRLIADLLHESGLAPLVGAWRSQPCGSLTAKPPEVIERTAVAEWKFSATFSTPIGELPGAITVFCVVGDKVPASIGGPFTEAVTVVVPGIVNFNHPAGGENIYVQRS